MNNGIARLSLATNAEDFAVLLAFYLDTGNSGPIMPLMDGFRRNRSALPTARNFGFALRVLRGLGWPVAMGPYETAKAAARLRSYEDMLRLQGQRLA